MKILIGTKNKGKVEAAQKAFSRFFENVEVEGIAVESEVPGQPINDEALQGAKNRVKNLKRYAKENDYKSFYKEEMKVRKLMKYPPYYYLVSLNISSKDSKLALVEAKKCEKVCHKYLDKTIILGPSPASIFKKQNIYYYQLILKYQYQDNIHEVLEKLV